MGAYIQPSDLETALGTARYIAIFDDDNDGVVETAAVDQVILRAETRMNRYAIEAYGRSWPPSPVPDEFKAMAIEYAIVIGEGRARHLTREDLDKKLEDLDDDMKDIAKGLTSLTASQPGRSAALPDDTAPLTGVAGAGLVNFDEGEGRGCTPTDWWRKEGCR